VKTKFIAIVQIETDDPGLTIERIAAGVRTALGTRSIRQAILEQLPHRATRVVAYLPEKQARLLMMLHESLGNEIGAPDFVRPPADYVAPKDGRKKAR
jgi:hypothetical protein